LKVLQHGHPDTSVRREAREVEAYAMIALTLPTLFRQGTEWSVESERSRWKSYKGRTLEDLANQIWKLRHAILADDAGPEQRLDTPAAYREFIKFANSINIPFHAQAAPSLPRSASAAASASSLCADRS
jgi:hypothetical protein